MIWEENASYTLISLPDHVGEVVRGGAARARGDLYDGPGEGAWTAVARAGG
jgi:hypothetical protein